METLGGSNFRGEDTLRGFRDYRFRDRDLALLQIRALILNHVAKSGGVPVYPQFKHGQ
jgi:hypothetical protein